MSEEKVQPTHRISFSEKSLDGNGREKLGAPVEVAVIWPRKGDKQGGILDWKISPEKLGNGVYFMLDNERQQSQGNTKAAPFEQLNNSGNSQGRGMER